MRTLLLVLATVLNLSVANAQKRWTEADRQALVENLKRTRDELVRETDGLTPEQWAFHENSERWSIGEIAEHLGTWEAIFARETAIALRSPADSTYSPQPDRVVQAFIEEEKPHVSPPYSRPTGLLRGKDNLALFLRTREQTIQFVQTTTADFRNHFEPASGGKRDVHQIFLVQWGHVDRHLRQIRKVKQHAEYPKASGAAKR